MTGAGIPSAGSSSGRRGRDRQSQGDEDGEGTTVVLVTHEPRVAAFAKREVIVRDGKVTPLFVERLTS
ncbi:hypothetical protein ABZY05_42030 [Streptomyces canus]|uniref:hypothetical protein n=1 Tax=Streptomyces canus TaxID=58343 RepID=UPI0033B8C150